jgi:hypothetical protein
MVKLSRISSLIAAGLILAIASSMVVPALASTPTNYYMNGGTTTVLEIPNQPKMQVYAAHYEPRSDDGPGNSIRLDLWAAKANAFMPVAIITTSPERADSLPLFFKGLLPETRTQLVSPWDVQIYRLGKNLVVSWLVPIKGTITGNGASGTPWSTTLGTSTYELPPGCIILKGYGEPITQTIHATGYPAVIIDMQSTSYSATGNIICPAWHYYGPVSTTSTVITSGVTTWTFK